MAYQLVMFGEDRIALQRELMYPEHSEVVSYIAKYPPAEFEMRIAEIAAYCGVFLDGDYMPEDFDKLCGILVKRLMEKRIKIILPAKH